MALDSQPPMYATYIGGGGEDRGYGIAAGASGEVYAAGRTNSPGFPTSPYAVQANLGGGTCDFEACPDAYFLAIGPGGSSLRYSTYLGGSGWDSARGIDLNTGGSAILTGEARSADFPLSGNARDTALSGGRDAFVSRISVLGLDLTYSSYLGGGNWDDGLAVRANPLNQVFLGGRTLSPDFPTTPSAYSGTLAGDYDAYGFIEDLPIENWIFLPLMRRGS